MSAQKYPYLINIFKGEERILIIPIIDHIGGYSIDSNWFVNINDMEDVENIGNKILEALTFVENSPVSKLTPRERDLDVAWKKNSKYKSWTSFWKNNHFAMLKLSGDGHYEIYSLKKSEERQGLYAECLKEISLSPDADIETIGQAVIDVFAASEQYYATHAAPSPYPEKEVKMLDGSKLVLKHPEDRHFTDSEDCGAAEIYQCYQYLPQEDAEPSADFFAGIASELDCDLSEENIRSIWEKLYGSVEAFVVQNCECGIYNLRAELKNKEVHKISYFRKMEEDLLLECSMEVHQPNRRKKLDERLGGMFEVFARGCRLS